MLVAWLKKQILIVTDIGGKIPDISGLLPASTFNFKVGELENKIKTVESNPDISNLANKMELKNVENKIPDSNIFVKKADYATEISGIKNDYVTNAALTSELNDLKSQQIADEVKKVDDKVSKNSTDIFGFESRLKQKEDTLNNLERETSFFRGNYYFNQQSYLIYEPRTFSFKQTSSGITHWKSSGIDNYSLKTDLRGVANTSGVYPKVFGQTIMSVIFSGNYVKENKTIYPTKPAVNIYIVYKLDAIKPTRNTDFTIQNALFGAGKITEDPSDSDHNKYNGYRIAFDEGSDFSFGNIVNGKNVILFGADMSFSSHERNRQNEIYVLGKYFNQGVTTVAPTTLSGRTKKGTTIYAEKVYKLNFTEPNKNFVLPLHCNGDDSYLFVNGGGELKFKAKTFSDQVKQNLLCLGNLSSIWSSINSTKTWLYGSVYDFAVDYNHVNSVKIISDIHRYLMKKTQDKCLV